MMTRPQQRTKPRRAPTPRRGVRADGPGLRVLLACNPVPHPRRSACARKRSCSRGTYSWRGTWERSTAAARFTGEPWEPACLPAFYRLVTFVVLLVFVLPPGALCSVFFFLFLSVMPRFCTSLFSENGPYAYVSRLSFCPFSSAVPFWGQNTRNESPT